MDSKGIFLMTGGSRGIGAATAVLAFSGLSGSVFLPRVDVASRRSFARH